MRIKGPGERGQFIYLFRMSGGFISSKKQESRYKLPRFARRLSWLEFFKRRKEGQE